MVSNSLPILNHRFKSADHYSSKAAYRILPFRFTRLDDTRYAATNLVGELVVLTRPMLETLVDGALSPHDPLYTELVRKHFILDDASDVALDLLAVKYRTKQSLLSEFTGLHIFVITLRCDHSCPYCQVSRVSSDKLAYDMSKATADRGIDFMFRSPNQNLKVEFQGGEPLLNFEMVKYIVERVEERNLTEQRNVSFVIATNLALVTAEILEFCKSQGIWISTSLDGPRELHNANRPRPQGNSYEMAIAGIRACRECLGEDSVSALLTCTKRSLEQPEAIIDEYLAQGFHSIFLRWLSPFGFASKSGRSIGYSTTAWNSFYERGLRYILSLNVRGIPFREEYASIILRKMLTPYPHGYVDLQSPTGLGLSVIVFNYDGDVYASDESRMLAEVDDKTFRLGSLHTNSYEDVFLSDRLLSIIESTMTEAIPGCNECAFEPFCGTDPVFHHATQGDMVGHRPTSSYCDRNMFVFRLLTTMLHDDVVVRDILHGWAS